MCINTTNFLYFAVNYTSRIPRGTLFVRWIITGLTVKQCSTVLIFVFAMKAEITNKYSCEHPSYSWIKNWTVYEDRTMHSSDNPINITRPHAWECVCMHMSVEPSSFSIFILIIRQNLLCLQQLSVKNKQSWLQNLSFNYRTLLYKFFIELGKSWHFVLDFSHNQNPHTPLKYHSTVLISDFF